MTVTHVMSERDARGVFGIWRKMAGDFQIDPFVLWIVVAEPIVCPTCGGMGVTYYGSGDTKGCPDCGGTMLPDVEIVSEKINAGPGPLSTRIQIPHNVVAIGATVPIIRVDDDSNYEYPFIVVYSDGFLSLATGPGSWSRTVITDQFGSQAVTPGHYAHPILSSPDGTDAAITAA